MSVLVITTGGTIGACAYPDPTTPPENSTMPGSNADYVRDFVGRRDTARKARCISMPPRDSKAIDAQYRQQIVQHIEQAAEPAVLITHGTDTLLKTAESLYLEMQNNPRLAQKSILITGAMTPLQNGKESDGYQNLEFSLDALKTAPQAAKVRIVLSDFAQDADPKSTAATPAWKPRLYDFEPGKYSKFYDTDGRYNRLRPQAK